VSASVAGGWWLLAGVWLKWRVSPFRYRSMWWDYREYTLRVLGGLKLLYQSSHLGGVFFFELERRTIKKLYTELKH
jgi:hypothetical protein